MKVELKTLPQAIAWGDAWMQYALQCEEEVSRLRIDLIHARADATIAEAERVLASPADSE